MPKVLDYLLRFKGRGIEVHIDPCKQTVTVVKGVLESKQQFLDLYHESVLLAFMGQIDLLYNKKTDGCIEPDLYDAARQLRFSGSIESVERLLLGAYHRFDNFKVVQVLK